MDDSDGALDPNSARHIHDDSGVEERQEDAVDSKHAYYDYAVEKSLSHTDARLIYRAHQDQGRTGSRNRAPSNVKGRLYGKSLRPESAEYVEAYESLLDGPGRVSHLPETNKSRATDHATRSPNKPPTVKYQDPKNGDISVDPVLDSELDTIYMNIRKILAIRRKYITLSRQNSHDDPRNAADWEIYPPPPLPAWQHQDEQNACNVGSERRGVPMSEQGIPHAPVPATERKMGTNIGEDFHLDDVPCATKRNSYEYEMDSNGVFQVFKTNNLGREVIVNVPTLRDFFSDLDDILNISSDGPAKSFAFRRLQYLEGKFNLYFLLNEYQETSDTKRVPHRDFYNVRKVDTHVHHSACMNQKHLLRFIKSKMKKCPNEIVLHRDGQFLTLQQVFESINLTAYDLSIDTLDMHAHNQTFHRFDKFNLKYNPVGESRLRTVFLKTDNHIKGRYLAELTKEVIADLEASKYQMVEWRISIYGRSIDEWDKLAAWVIDNKLISPNVRWLIQVPRLYDVYANSGLMTDFQQVITNIFQPLFQATADPIAHRKLNAFLQRVVGFDSVDDESKPERRLFRKFPTPSQWTTKQNPPYNYWIYYLFANITSLNAWRAANGMNTFVLRPHCGEAGETDHLAAAVLCCHSISHGILLKRVPLLQYIFYLEQIGIAMSPLSNNALFLAYERNPFIQYFRRGLNVSLSTDDPLQIAFTKEPLIEEYSVAAQIYKLNAVDMCELAKNSVLQSGFEHVIKKRWLGETYLLPGAPGNSVEKSNVPDIREAHRFQTLCQEHVLISDSIYLEKVSHELRGVPGIDDREHQSGPERTKQNALSITGNSSTSFTQNHDEDYTNAEADENVAIRGLRKVLTEEDFGMSATEQPKIFPGAMHNVLRRS